jgi:hypothetical protein
VCAPTTTKRFEQILGDGLRWGHRYVGTPRGRGVKFEKVGHKNAMKHENRGPPLDFLATPSTPLQIICLKPQGPPPLGSKDCASTVETNP